MHGKSEGSKDLHLKLIIECKWIACFKI